MHGGIVLNTKRMNKILEINKGNMIGRAECGVVPSSFLCDRMPHIGTQTDGHEAKTLWGSGNKAACATHNYFLPLFILHPHVKHQPDPRVFHLLIFDNALHRHAVYYPTTNKIHIHFATLEPTLAKETK